MTHGTSWKDAEIEAGIREAMRILQIDRMPTSTEIRALRIKGLDTAIQRSKRYSGWAKHLGIDVKLTHTSMGDKYEGWVKRELELRGFHVKHTSNGHPYDLLLNNSVKVDVKSTSAHNHFGSRGHTFPLSKKLPTCDIYVLIALNEEVNIEKTLIIPSHIDLPITLNIGRNSKYDVFEDRWELFDNYSHFYLNVSHSYKIS